MKRKLLNLSFSLFVSLFLLIVSGCGNSWEKKQFDTDEDVVNAFKYARYKDVKEKFGEPYYKFLDVMDQEITYRWHGVGVKGKSDAYLIFSAMEYGYAHFSGFEFKTWYQNDGYNAPSNDNTYTID